MITPKNWAEFQHYKHRSPPWIKLHRSLLTDAKFLRLPVASRALAPCIWLIASENPNGVIEASNADVAFRLHMSEDEFNAAMAPLISFGFLECDSVVLADCEQDASKVLAQRESTEGEREKNILSEVGKRPPPARKAIIYDLAFENFWKTYPDRRNNSKPAAFREWEKLSDEDQRLATESLAAFSAYCRKTPDYRVVHCERYLRDRRFDGWADQPAQPVFFKV